MDIDIKDKLISYLQNVEDFASEQIPDLLQQVVTYSLFNNLLCIIACVLVIYVLNRICSSLTDSQLDTYSIPVFFMFIVICFSFCYLCISVKELLKCYFAPKMFLLEYFMTLKG